MPLRPGTPRPRPGDTARRSARTGAQTLVVSTKVLEGWPRPRDATKRPPRRAGPPPPPVDSTPPPPATDQPPYASFTSSCPHGQCTFDAGGSTDDHGIVTYAWDFGDGSAPASGTTPITTHSYLPRGQYTV